MSLTVPSACASCGSSSMDLDELRADPIVLCNRCGDWNWWSGSEWRPAPTRAIAEEMAEVLRLAREAAR